MRINVKPELLLWARERANMNIDVLVHRFPKYREWESGEVQPTLKQLEKFAKTTHAAVGYFFLSEPPDEPLPIPDFRTIGGKLPQRPSPDLLETLYLCQQRQDWYQDFARIEGKDRLSFIGSATLSEDIESVAARIRSTLGLDLQERHVLQTWTDALRRFVELADTLGVLVMVSGIVGSNTHRRLDPDEFRGFALVDDLAPLVFINGADTKAAQMFTLAHELAHLWLGESALSDTDLGSVPAHDIEVWCNRVAAELLVPLDSVRREDWGKEPLPDALSRLARRFKVSTLVVLRRIYDADGLTWHQFRRAYDKEMESLRSIPAGTGGNFYSTQPVRTGQRFTRAVVSSTLEGHTLYRDALHLLGFSKVETFHKLAANLGLR